LKSGGFAAPPSLGNNEVILTQGELRSEHHFLALGFEMGRHGATGSLAAFVEGKVVVAKPVLGAESVEFVRFCHSCFGYPMLLLLELSLKAGIPEQSCCKIFVTSLVLLDNIITCVVVLCRYHTPLPPHTHPPTTLQAGSSAPSQYKLHKANFSICVFLVLKTHLFELKPLIIVLIITTNTLICIGPHNSSWLLSSKLITPHLHFEHSSSNKTGFVMERIVLVVLMPRDNGCNCKLHPFRCGNSFVPG
jgi:hypothetical protein